ncbi:MAG: hypothetical protein KDN20_07485 [Verrucomicrobiae bacterium]|nr:hypothetical protein [Verrucomicrobiae bacterium]
MNRVEYWESFRSEAMGAYSQIPTDGSATLEEVVTVFDSVPDIPRQISDFQLTGKEIIIEADNPKAMKPLIIARFIAGVRHHLGMPTQPFKEAHYMTLFSDGTPVIFVEEDHGTERARFQFWLDFSIRSKSLIIYPHAGLYHERLQNRFLVPKGIATVVGTLVFFPLPFILLGVRALRNIWRKLGLSSIPWVSPRDVSHYNPMNLGQGCFLKETYARRWMNESANEIMRALREVDDNPIMSRHVERRSSPSGSSPVADEEFF